MSRSNNVQSPDETDAMSARAALIRQLDEERGALFRKRLRTLFLVAIMVSLLVHLAGVFYLNNIYRDQPGRPVEEFQVQFAIVQEEDLEDIADGDLEELEIESLSVFDDALNEQTSAELTPDVSAADLEISPTGATPTLGGAGDTGLDEGGLGGSGAAASFFGVKSSGERFVYIVDTSGSMGNHGKMPEAMRELIRSIRVLPDFAKFHVLLYASAVREPPMQHGWNLARRTTVNRFATWLAQVQPGGGTNPGVAFRKAFELSPRPDVIFFLTDGEISSMSADDVSNLNQGGRRVVINTIAFGNRGSQTLLEEIARDSGGNYTYVQTGEAP